MENLIETINQIIKYGLGDVIAIVDKEKDLEENLIKLYSKSLDIKYRHEENDYVSFNKSSYPDVTKNINRNFPDFGWYHTVANSHKIVEKANVVTGDAVDDLNDIIYDLLQIKWRYKNNSVNNALWYFEFIFEAHTKDHLIDLIKFMRSKQE